jgi:hypothetical protein
LIFDLPDATGSKAPKFIYEKQNKNVFRDAQRKKYGVLIKSPKFIYGDSFCPLPPAFCLLNSRTRGTEERPCTKAPQGK